MSSDIVVAGDWKNNGELIRDAIVPLGHLRHEWLTLDLTHGLGAFWKHWTPERLIALEVDWAKHLHPRWRRPSQYMLGDAMRLPFRPRTFDVVVVDAPYKLNGTATDIVDGPYGVERWASAEDRHLLMAGMLRAATEVVVPGGRVLFKCQAQVNSGTRWWQDQMFTRYGETLGLDLVDRLELPSERGQPKRSTCARCYRPIMERSDGRWGTLERDPKFDDRLRYRCGELEFEEEVDADGMVWHREIVHPHEPHPDDVGQDHARNNRSTMLIFIRSGRPRTPAVDITGLEYLTDVPARAGAEVRPPKSRTKRQRPTAPPAAGPPSLFGPGDNPSGVTIHIEDPSGAAAARRRAEDEAIARHYLGGPGGQGMRA